MLHLTNEELKFCTEMYKLDEEGRKKYIEDNESKLLCDAIKGDTILKRKLIQRIFNEYSAERYRIDSQSVQIFESDISWIHLGKTKTERKIMFCLCCQKYLHPHKNGWIYLDWPNVLQFAFTNDEIEKIKIESLQTITTLGLDMRVIGSKKPKLCFSIPPHNLLNEDSVYSATGESIKELFDMIEASEGDRI